MAIFDNEKLMTAIKDHYRLDYENGLHGLPHWARVRDRGIKLWEVEGGRKDVVELFAVLHDSCRESDGRDMHHGPRAVEFARGLRGKAFEIDDAGWELLALAMRDHTFGQTEADITVQVCWDADRLDISRVGIIPDPARMCTAEGKRLADRM